MTERVATCRCGQLQARCTDEPVRVSVCHCLECQKRSGSAFAVQARWADDQVDLTGAFSESTRVSESGNSATFRFCGECGSTVAYVIDAMPGLVAIPVGAFADPTFPAPQVSGYEERKHDWVVVLGDDVEHFD